MLKCNDLKKTRERQGRKRKRKVNKKEREKIEMKNEIEYMNERVEKKTKPRKYNKIRWKVKL